MKARSPERNLVHVPHDRRCEICGGMFLWRHNLALVNLDMHYRCPQCRRPDKTKLPPPHLIADRIEERYDRRRTR